MISHASSDEQVHDEASVASPSYCGPRWRRGAVNIAKEAFIRRQGNNRSHETSKRFGKRGSCDVVVFMLCRLGSNSTTRRSPRAKPSERLNVGRE